MALLRRCFKIIERFNTTTNHRHIDYIRRVASSVSFRGYVTETDKNDYHFENTKIQEKPKTEIVDDEIRSNSLLTDSSRRSTSNLQQRLSSLCLRAEDGEVEYDELFQIFENLGKDRLDSEAKNIGLELLESCGHVLKEVEPQVRRNLASRVWTLINREGENLGLEHYHALLKIHEQNRETIDAKKFLLSMSVEPDETTYLLLLRVIAKHDDVESATYILSTMKDIGCSINETVFNCLIETHLNKKDIKGALSVLDSMRNSGIEPSVETYSILALGHASLGDLDSIRNILNKCPLDAADVIAIVKRLGLSDFGKFIPDILKFLPGTLHQNNFILVDAIGELTRARKEKDAFLIVKCLSSKENSEETDSLMKVFFKEAIEAGIATKVILEFTDENASIAEYTRDITNVSEAALMVGNEELAIATFEAMQKKNIPVRPHYYWPLLINASKSGEEDVIRILKHMQSLRLAFDHETIYKYVLPRIDITEPFYTLNKLIDIGIGLPVSLTPLICYFIDNGKINDALSLAVKIKGQMDFDKIIDSLANFYNVNKNAKDCAKMLKYAPPEKYYPDRFLEILFGDGPIQADRENDLEELIRVLEMNDITIKSFKENRPGKEIKKNHLESITDSGKIPHPKFMNIEQLECHLIQLRTKGMNCRGTLRRLVQLHSKENNIDRIDEIKELYDKNNYLWSPGMYSSLIELYSKNNRVQEAYEVYNKINENYGNFKIDDFKILSLATGLINENRVKEAISVLESCKSGGGERISKNCWQLLDAVARSSNSEFTEGILEVLVKSGFCQKTNALFGPVIRRHLLKNDLESAVNVFKRCAEDHRQTPLRQELISSLVKAVDTEESADKRREATELLKEVANISMKIYGPRIKTDIVVAYARNGMQTELRNFLEINGLVDETLDQNLTLVPAEEKLPILTAILDASTELPAIYSSAISEKILTIHCHSGNYQEAIKLWKKMFAENRPQSRLFRKKFVDLLDKYKVPLPEDFNEIR